MTKSKIEQIYKYLEPSPESPKKDHICRPAKRLKFDEDDNEKLEKLKERQTSPDPEPVTPGEVDNKRILNIASHLTPRSGIRYLASKVIKIEHVSPEKEKQTSTPKKEKRRSKDKLKEANKKTKEVLARLSAKLDKPENIKRKVISESYIQIYTNHILILGCWKVMVSKVFHIHRKPNSPGGNKISTLHSPFPISLLSRYVFKSRDPLQFLSSSYLQSLQYFNFSDSRFSILAI